MQFLDLAAKRYSVLHYSDKQIEKDAVDSILQAGRLAPTACNNQPQRILVITSDKGRKLIQKVTNCSLYFPLAMLVCYDKDACWQRKIDGKLSGEIDASIVATHMILEATDLGIGSIWVMSWNPEDMRDVFVIPNQIEPVALLIMGYPQ